MKERLKDYLEHGEEILWHGRAEQFEAMDKTHKAYYIRRGVIAAAVLILLIALYIPTAIKTGAGIKPGVVIVIAAAGLYGVFSPLSGCAEAAQNGVCADQRKTDAGHLRRCAQREALRHSHRPHGQR